MTQPLITQSECMEKAMLDECPNFSSISDSEILNEYIRRFTISAGEPIRDAGEAAFHFRAFFAGASKREFFVVCFLNAQHRVLSTEILFAGSISTAAVFPREVVTRIIELGANAVMFAHNHPSGSVTPSGSDRAVTKKLQTVLAAIDVDVLDHIIVGGSEYFSFADHRLI
jgi:DNA repair protein RadC